MIWLIGYAGATSLSVDEGKRSVADGSNNSEMSEHRDPGR